jgi:hypothetical protein
MKAKEEKEEKQQLMNGRVNFEKSPKGLYHIIWNVLLTDKTFKISPEILDRHNIKYIISILPSEDDYYKEVQCICDHSVMTYSEHKAVLDIERFDIEIKKMEECRRKRENILIFCNNGYQRSIPFLCHYLTAHHADECPNIASAIDLILPQVDKENYSNIRNDYIKNIEKLFVALE